MSAPSKAKVKYTYEQKWGADDPFVNQGYTQVPFLLLKYAHRLLIEPDEGYLICQIWRFKWTPSNEGPSEKLLAEAIGKSDDTVRKLLHRLVKRGYLRIERKRGDFGYYTHTIYNFDSLRSFLNECHYQDHPQERPRGQKPLALPVKPETTAQLRGVVRKRQADRENALGLDAESGGASPQSCGTLIESVNEVESEKEISLALFQESEKPVNAAKRLLEASDSAFAKARRNAKKGGTA